MKLFKNIDCKSLFLGVVLGGILVGILGHLYAFNYRGHMREAYSFSEKRATFSKRFGTSTEMMMGHDMNPYMMSKVTSEQQFLKDMVLHHQAAVTMAEQVLTLNPSDKVRALATSIIQTQTTETENMKSWITK